MEHEMTFLKMGSPDTYLLRLMLHKNFLKEDKSIFLEIWKATQLTTERKIEILTTNIKPNQSTYMQYILVHSRSYVLFL